MPVAVLSQDQNYWLNKNKTKPQIQTMINRQIKPGGSAKPNAMAPATSKSEPALFSGGMEELVSFDANGMTQLGKGKKKPFQSSESMTETFSDFAKEKNAKKLKQKQQPTQDLFSY